MISFAVQCHTYHFDNNYKNHDKEAAMKTEMKKKDEKNEIIVVNRGINEKEVHDIICCSVSYLPFR